MNNTDLLLLAASFCALVAVIIYFDEPQNPSKKQKYRKKRIWAREWLLHQPHKGAYNGILTNLCLTDQEDFQKFLQTNTETFQVKLSNVILEAATKGVFKNNTDSEKNCSSNE